MSEPKPYPPRRRRVVADDWPDQPVISGPVRISGTVLDGDAGWYVYRDGLGWTNVVLLGREEADPRWRVGLDPTLAEAADLSADPAVTAEMVARRLGPASRNVGFGVIRIAPHHGIAEVLNVSLPALVHWDVREGMVPYEPLARGLGHLPSGAVSEVVRLAPGSAVVGATRGFLPHTAGWRELRDFMSATAVDPIGGDVAEAAPSEIGRMLRRSWRTLGGPTGVVVVGVPRVGQQVA